MRLNKNVYASQPASQPVSQPLSLIINVIARLNNSSSVNRNLLEKLTSPLGRFPLAVRQQQDGREMADTNAFSQTKLFLPFFPKRSNKSGGIDSSHGGIDSANLGL